MLDIFKEKVNKDTKNDLPIEVKKDNIFKRLIDDNCETDAVWIDTKKFINRELKIYPEQVFKYLD